MFHQQPSWFQTPIESFYAPQATHLNSTLETHQRNFCCKCVTDYHRHSVIFQIFGLEIFLFSLNPQTTFIDENIQETLHFQSVHHSHKMSNPLTQSGLKLEILKHDSHSCPSDNTAISSSAFRVHVWWISVSLFVSISSLSLNQATSSPSKQWFTFSSFTM